MKLRITILKYHSWYLCQISLQIMLLPVLIFLVFEIPGELSRENLISSHVKITCYLHMWKYDLCYGYIINRAFHTQKLLRWNGVVFHWCLYNKYNITWPLGDTKFLFSCWKNISRVRCAHPWNIFQHSKGNFVSPCSHVASSIYCTIINAKTYLSILSFVGDFVTAIISVNFISFYLRV